jgi:hypothetical protein
VAQVTPRLRKRVEHDFQPGAATDVLRYLDGLSDSEYGGQCRERVEAALVLASRGRRERFESTADLRRPDGPASAGAGDRADDVG